jgi:DNA-binding PadR family transcriptional regulator
VKLNATSYAVLGHLAMGPWNMYDLAAQMRRNVHYFFPRAESQVYAEPKRLVEMGLATAEAEATGKRSRTVYAITDAGRDELRRWLSDESRPPRLEFEALLRVIFAPFGDQNDLAAAIRQSQDGAREIFTLGEHICDEYLSGSAPLQRYVIARSMLHDFLWSYAEFIDAWAERSLARIDAWNDESVAEQHRAALEAYRVHTHLARPEPADIPVHDFHGDSVGDSIKGQS